MPLWQCESMTCIATQCIQVCQDAKCVMTCPRDAKRCAQFGYVPLLGRITVKCDEVECQQSCYNGDCDMICPHGVSTCTQEAYDGNMTLRCDADECHQVCYRDNCIMTCSERVNQCDQFCFKGNCQYECYAKICKHSCLAGPCKEGNSLASTLPAVTTTTRTKFNGASLQTTSFLWGALIITYDSLFV